MNYTEEFEDLVMTVNGNSSVSMGFVHRDEAYAVLSTFARLVREEAKQRTIMPNRPLTVGTAEAFNTICERFNLSGE